MSVDNISHASKRQEAIPTVMIKEICDRLAANKRIHQALPGGVSLHMDRLLPFLCVYRRDPSRRDEGTEKIVMSEAAHLVLSGTTPTPRGLGKLVRGIAETAAAKLGAFLLIEVWTQRDGDVSVELDEATGEALLPAPGFRIVPRRAHQLADTTASLEFALQRIRLHHQLARVTIDYRVRNHPDGMTSLLTQGIAAQSNCHVLGLEVRPVFRDPTSGEVSDLVLRSLCRQVSRAVKKACFTFALNHTAVRPEHYFSLGNRKLPSQVWAVDRQLAEISAQFKFLLLVTPVNAERSWQEFSAGRYRSAPKFQYRPLDTDPLLLKRRLLRIGTERVDDPTLGHVFRQTQVELDRQITMLGDIGTAQFLPGSLQVFGRVETKLLDLAWAIQKRLSRSKPEEADHGPSLEARQFVRLARKEFKYYRRQSPSFQAEALIRDDMYSGLLVTGGKLLVGRETSIPQNRAMALLQHEVGTHLLTYYNGATQPLRLLRVGLAGYDAFQEGMAVLAEFLVGELSDGRLRTLAARVVAADRVARATPFTEVFEELVEAFGFSPRAAYTVTLRTFRGGGLTKDALYLRGLVQILNYVGKGGDLETLLVGKFAASHVPLVRELLLRGVLRRPLLRPRYLDWPQARQRLATITERTTPLELISDGEVRNKGNRRKV